MSKLYVALNRDETITAVVIGKVGGCTLTARVTDRGDAIRLRVDVDSEEYGTKNVTADVALDDYAEIKNPDAPAAELVEGGVNWSALGTVDDYFASAYASAITYAAQWVPGQKARMFQRIVEARAEGGK